MNASFGQNIVDECSSLSSGIGYERILNNTEVKFSCVETLWWLPESAAPCLWGFQLSPGQMRETDLKTNPRRHKNTQTPHCSWPKNRGISKATEPQDSVRSVERWLDEDRGMLYLSMSKMTACQPLNILFQDVPKRAQVNYTNTKTIVIHEMVTVDGFNTDILILLTRTEHRLKLERQDNFLLSF